MFAIDFLSDYLGRKAISQCEIQHISGFANFIAYIVNREIDLADDMDHFSVESMVKNGVFGHGNGMGYGEHIMIIKLEYKDLIDEIEWDISNPDN